MELDIFTIRYACLQERRLGLEKLHGKGTRANHVDRTNDFPCSETDPDLALQDMESNTSSF